MSSLFIYFLKINFKETTKPTPNPVNDLLISKDKLITGKTLIIKRNIYKYSGRS